MKTDNEKLHDLYSLPNIIQVIKPRKLGWQGMGQVWRIGKV